MEQQLLCDQIIETGVLVIGSEATGARAAIEAQQRELMCYLSPKV